MPSSRSACRGAISAMRWASRARRRTGACSISARRMPPAKGPLVALDRKGEPLADQDGARRRPQGHRGAGRQLGAGQGAVVAQRLADQAPPLRRRARRARRSTATCASEARPDAVSTLEAVALALSVLRRRCGAAGKAPGAVPRADRQGAQRRASGTSNGIVGNAVSPYNRAMLDQPQIPVAQRTNPERSFTRGGARAQAGRRRGLPRRGHPRRHQGHPAVGRGLCRRLPGRAGLASGRRAGRIARTCSTSWASISRPAPTRPRRRRCWAPRSTIRCAAASPGSRSSAPTWRPMRSATSPRPA